jgi:hypothetical protein
LHKNREMAPSSSLQALKMPHQMRLHLLSPVL